MGRAAPATVGRCHKPPARQLWVLTKPRLPDGQAQISRRDLDATVRTARPLPEAAAVFLPLGQRAAPAHKPFRTRMEIQFQSEQRPSAALSLQAVRRWTTVDVLSPALVFDHLLPGFHPQRFFCRSRSFWISRLVLDS